MQINFEQYKPTCGQDCGVVAILLAVKNGEKFLKYQLDSIYSQTYANWVIYASDDGSSDQTLAILRDYKKRWGGDRVKIYPGPQKGFSQNFLNLIYNKEIKAEFYAFCDQDDIWLPSKIEVAVKNLMNLNCPALYCGATRYIDNYGKHIGDSEKFILPTSFRNALIQCIAGGNTMVFNDNSRCLMVDAPNVAPASHDWWVYILVSGVGGKVIYDTHPHVLYRQHIDSLIGQNKTFISKLIRFKSLIKGSYKNQINSNVNSLKIIENMLTIDNKIIFNLFCKMRTKRLKERIRLMEVCGLYRQTWRGTLAMFFAVIVNKI